MEENTKWDSHMDKLTHNDGVQKKECLELEDMKSVALIADCLESNSSSAAPTRIDPIIQ